MTQENRAHYYMGDGQVFHALASDRGPDYLSSFAETKPIILKTINTVVVHTGTRKGFFISFQLGESVSDTDGNELPVTIREPFWYEDVHKDAYVMPGLTAVFKSAVAPEGTEYTDGQLILSSDVSTHIEGVSVHRPLDQDNPDDIRQQVAERLGKDQNVEITSQVAGLVTIDGQHIGAVMNPATTFVVSKLSESEIEAYVTSLSDFQLRRAPGGILWPHPLIEQHIESIDGIAKDDDGFEPKYIDFLKSVLGTPTEILDIIKFLDTRGAQHTDPQGNIFGFINGTDMGLFNSNQEFVGTWVELVQGEDRGISVLRNAREPDFIQMSAIASRNFRESPNYSYLREPGNEQYLRQYIEANTLEGVADLRSKPNTICSLVLEKDGEILGFRVVRKVGLVADGRRMHTSLDYVSRGVGSLLLSRSEHIAKQAGCACMEVHATGDSFSWFERKGFVDIGIRQNTISEYHLMIKQL